jgi:hypothetical protein
MTRSIWQVRRRAFCTWLLRGATGLALLAVAISTRESLVVIPALLLALIAFRGCPLCWAFGLVERGSRDCPPSAKDAS